MTQPRIPAALLLLFLSITAGCGSDEPPPPPPAGPVEVTITEALDGASTALKVGHVLRVELPAAPLSGFAWEVASVGESVLRVPVEEYLPPDEEGQPGTSIWRFEAVGVGTTTLTMRYVSFTDEIPGEQPTFTFSVLVD